MVDIKAFPYLGFVRFDLTNKEFDRQFNIHFDDHIQELAVGAWGKRLQKLLHRTVFTPCGQHVESKAIADVQQGLHRPVFRYGHSEARR